MPFNIKKDFEEPFQRLVEERQRNGQSLFNNVLTPTPASEGYVQSEIPLMLPSQTPDYVGRQRRRPSPHERAAFVIRQGYRAGFLTDVGGNPLPRPEQLRLVRKWLGEPYPTAVTSPNALWTDAELSAILEGCEGLICPDRHRSGELGKLDSEMADWERNEERYGVAGAFRHELDKLAYQINSCPSTYTEYPSDTFRVKATENLPSLDWLGRLCDDDGIAEYPSECIVPHVRVLNIDPEPCMPMSPEQLEAIADALIAEFKATWMRDSAIESELERLKDEIRE